MRPKTKPRRSADHYRSEGGCRSIVVRVVPGARAGLAYIAASEGSRTLNQSFESLIAAALEARGAAITDNRFKPRRRHAVDEGTTVSLSRRVGGSGLRGG